jgi:hypothetical protein
MARRRVLGPNEVKFWADVTARQVQEWTVTLLDRYSDSYASNQFRALQYSSSR